ncbi:UDP-N-acetylmuramate--L-alanine ligase [Ancrocorticia populi]|uniref:UDP-N-acetylmuramate--L-alanine ligase n=1 Tax=Ancrocorticia populi TaxID=2175228 RepID=UPI003F9BA191
MGYYFIGIGGAGMSVVAELLLAEGQNISGSDAKASTTTDYLAGLGINVFIGQDASNVPEDATVVTSSAIRESNPELAIARMRGQSIMHRSEALALASRGRQFVAVAGAHGKTTTSAMLASVLRELEGDPSWAIGGTVTGIGAGGHRGSGSVFVAEADESDASFLNYSPRLEIVTNVEPDHLDHYGTAQAFEEAFVEFAHRLVPGGLLVACTDDPGAARLAASAATAGIRLVTYGRGEGLSAAERHVRISEESHSGGRARGVFSDSTGSYDVELQIVGAHNLLNAAGTWAAATELGYPGADVARALASFSGTGRRFEKRGEADGITVIDDYAHHPTEVEATLMAAREYAGEGRVIALFQPHLYSRTQNFAAEFAQALSLADRAIVTAVYAAREDPIPGVEGSLISDLMAGGEFVEDRAEAAAHAADVASAGDVILTIGAGDVTELGPVILERIAHR